MNRLHWFRKHDIFTIAVVLELLFLLILLIGSLAPRAVYSFGEDNEVLSETEAFSIKDGAYRVLVTYDAGALDEEQEGNCTVMVGSCTLSSNTHGSALSTCNVKLDAGHTTAEAYAWVRFGSRVSDAVFSVNAQTEGLKVHSILVEEQMVYRVTRFLGWLFLFAVIDFFWLLFFGDIARLKPLAETSQKKYTIAALLIICVVINLPLMTNHLFVMHDIGFHLNRIYCMAQELRNGQFPVRIETETLNGYGYVASIMYGNLFLYLPAVLVALMVPLGNAYKIFAAFINCATCLIAYWTCKKLSGKRWIALVGSAVYTFSSYRLINMFLRGTAGEYTAMMCVPLVIVGFHNVLFGEERSYRMRDYLPIVLGLTGIINSHVISAEMTGLFILLSCLLCVRRVFQKKRFFALVKAAVLTILLNLWFLVPFVEYYGEDLRFHSMLQTAIQTSGVYLGQLFEVLLSVTGSNYLDSMTGEFGLGIGLSLSVSLLLVFLYQIRYHGRAEGDAAALAESEREAIFLGFLGCFAMFMASNLFPWDSLQDISVRLAQFMCSVQFPWRYLAIATPFLVMMMTVQLGLLDARLGTKTAQRIGIVLVGCALVPALIYFNDVTHQLEERNYYSDNELELLTVGGGEYLYCDETTGSMQKAEVWEDDPIVVDQYEKVKGVAYLTCKNTSDDTALASVPVVAYPNYVAYDQATGEEIYFDNAWWSRITLYIPAGYDGTICVRYQVPLHWRLAEVISLLALLGIVFTVYRTRRKN